MESQTKKKEKQTIKRELEIPEGITTTIEKDVLTIKKGEDEIKQSIDLSQTKIEIAGNKINLETKHTNKTSKKQTLTTLSLIKNIIKGLEEGHTYKLKICEGHFPMTVTVKGSNLEIKNFVGERKPRIVPIYPEVTVTVNAQEITVTGKNKELTGEQAAKIEQVTRRRNFDKRKFQEGIYITEKSGKKIV